MSLEGQLKDEKVSYQKLHSEFQVFLQLKLDTPHMRLYIHIQTHIYTHTITYVPFMGVHNHYGWWR